MPSLSLQQCNTFNDWNTLVAVNSHRRLLIDGPFIRLMACNDDTYEPPQLQYDKYHLIRVKDHNPLDGDDFPPRNKGHNVMDWLNGLHGPENSLPHPDDIIALIDPEQGCIPPPPPMSSITRSDFISPDF